MHLTTTYKDKGLPWKEGGFGQCCSFHEHSCSKYGPSTCTHSNGDPPWCAQTPNLPLDPNVQESLFLNSQEPPAPCLKQCNSNYDPKQHRMGKSATRRFVSNTDDKTERLDIRVTGNKL